MKGTREKILSSAQKLFAKQGFDGTSISEIAKKADVNQSLIYHYFENKEKLWKEVKAYLLEGFYPSCELMIDVKGGLLDFLKQIVVQRFELYDQNPDVVRIASWQRLENKRKTLAGGNPAAPGNWKDPIVQLQKRGEIRKDLDPDMIVLFITSVISGAFMEDYAGIHNLPERKEKYVQMMIECIYNALK